MKRERKQIVTDKRWNNTCYTCLYTYNIIWHVPRTAFHAWKNTQEKLTKKNPERIILFHGNNNDNQ